MQATIDTKELVNALRTLAYVVRRGPRPILDCVRMKVGEGEMVVEGTDLETAARIALPVSHVDSNDECVAVVNLAALTGAVKDIKQGSVNLSFNGEELKVNDSTKFICEDPDEFPFLPDPNKEKDEWTPVLAGDLVKFFKKCAFAVAKDMSCYAYNGMLLEAHEGGFSAAGTDGRRLIVSGPYDQDVTWSEVVPVRALYLFARFFNTPWLQGCDAFVLPYKNQIAFKSENVIVMARTLEGDFPKYRDVIPKEDTPKRIIFNRMQFQDAIKQAATTTDSEIKLVELNITKEGDCHLHSEKEGVGETNLSVPFKFKADPFEMKVAFNPVFILDYLNTYIVDQVRVSLAFTDEGSGARLMNCDPSTFYVLMPISDH